MLEHVETCHNREADPALVPVATCPYCVPYRVGAAAQRADWIAEIGARVTQHHDQLLLHDEGDPDYARFEGAAKALDALREYLEKEAPDG